MPDLPYKFRLHFIHCSLILYPLQSVPGKLTSRSRISFALTISAIVKKTGLLPNLISFAGDLRLHMHPGGRYDRQKLSLPEKTRKGVAHPCEVCNSPIFRFTGKLLTGNHTVHFEYTGRDKFAELVADHVFRHKDGNEALAIMHIESMSDKIRNNQ